MCSLYLVVMFLSDCPTYFRLHVLYLISYIPLGLLLCFFYQLLVYGVGGLECYMDFCISK